ncbi:hypothetical protein ACIO93_36760 [Streptomyces sp. NPDC087903]|uniref:hypothetical protein n=1 Tax=Streptomyces sp. NPDC087903 TaxID=3365819 RepID=UPI00382A984C
MAVVFLHSSHHGTYAIAAALPAAISRATTAVGHPFTSTTSGAAAASAVATAGAHASS